MAIAAVGSVIRVLFIWFRARADGPVGDQLFYSAQALTNARGEWFEQPFASGLPAADHPPLTALVLTPVSWMFEWTGSVVTIQRLFMAVIGVSSIVMIAALGRMVAGPRVGLVAAGWTAIYANVWVNDGLIMSESLTFAVVIVLTALVLRQCENPTRRRSFAIGLVVGAAALTRTELVLLVVIVPVLFAVAWRVSPTNALRHWVRETVVLVAAAGLVISPWVVWNQLRFDGPVFISTNDGMTLAGAHCDHTYVDDVGGWDIWCAYATHVPASDDAAQASARMRSAGLTYWREHLGRSSVVAAARLARVASVGYIGASARASTAEGRPIWVSYLGAVQYWAMIPVAALGLRRLRSIQRLVLVACAPIVVLVAIVANAYVRFRIPAEVGLILAASVGVVSLVTSTERSRA